MRIEQRIGRVHRLGQAEDVKVINFVLRDTVDDYVVRLLYQKINLFTMTVGELETVLSDTQDGEVNFEERILDAMLRHTSLKDTAREVEALGNEVLASQERVRSGETMTQGVLG